MLIFFSDSFAQVVDPNDPTDQNKMWYPHGGYLNKESFVPGDTIKFYISTHSSVSNYNIKIGREGDDDDNPFANTVHTSPSLQGVDQGIPSPEDSAYHYGAGWSESYRYVIPSSWDPGVYRAQFKVVDTLGIPYEIYKYRNIEFIIRPSVPGSLSDILYVISDMTFHAYNNWGGKSVYPSQSTDDLRSYILSLNRPINEYFTPDYIRWVEPLRAWLYQQGSQYIPEFANQYDIETIPNLLQNYKLVLFVGHDEYWSWHQMQAVKNYLSSGGTVGIFGGDVCWWQIRYEDNGRTMVCYKDDGGETEDPLEGIQDSLVTVNFYNAPVNYPENQVTGLSYRSGGYVCHGTSYLPVSEGWGGYNDLYNTQSWVFRGTGLAHGDTLGYRGGDIYNQYYGIVGYEVDGCEFTYQNGIPVVTGNDGTPLTFKILGVSEADYSNHPPNRHAVMGMYRTKSGGWLFHSGTIRWSCGLQARYWGPAVPEVQQITKNVIDKFLRLSRIP